MRGIKQRFQVSEFDPSKSWFKPQKKEIKAVDGVELTIPKGTIFGLLGYRHRLATDGTGSKDKCGRHLL